MGRTYLGFSAQEVITEYGRNPGYYVEWIFDKGKFIIEWGNERGKFNYLETDSFNNAHFTFY